MALILYLIRHLAPNVAPGVCYGRSDLAVEPATQLAALPQLRTQLPTDTTDCTVFTSPLQRCATLAADLFGKRAISDARLMELDFGSWEMRPWDSIARADIDAWVADLAHFRPGGGESVYAMAQRVAAFEAGLPPDGSVVVVCHAGVIRLLCARWLGLDPAQMARDAAGRAHSIGYGEVVVLTRP